MITACRTQAYFVSPNHLQNAPGTLYQANGDTISGVLSLNNEVVFPKDIQVVRPHGTTEQVHLPDVDGMEVGGTYYELKHKSNKLRPSSGFYFMERLTPADAKMQLYVHQERRQKGKSLQQVAHEPVYYLQLPGEKQDLVWASDSKRLAPHFEKKMARIVKDCPALADSIKNKNSGFFYSRLNATEAERGKVLQKIVAAYNACNQGQ